MSPGFWYGLGAYTLWGLFPVYFKLIGFVPADQIIAHRIVWSFLLLAAVVTLGSLRRETWLAGISTSVGHNRSREAGRRGPHSAPAPRIGLGRLRRAGAPPAAVPIDCSPFVRR